MVLLAMRMVADVFMDRNEGDEGSKVFASCRWGVISFEKF